MENHKTFYLNLYKGVIIKFVRNKHNSISSLSKEEKIEVKRAFKTLRVIYLKIMSYEGQNGNIYMIRKCIFNYLYYIKMPSTKI